MTKFFLPLTLVLLIAWLVIGLEQERQKKLKETASKAEKIIEFYDSLLTSEDYKNYKLVTKNDLYFLLPESYYERNDLTDEYNAILQYSNSNSDFFMVLYKDSLATDSLAFNFSKETYVSSTLSAIRQHGEVIVLDSSNFNFNNINALKANFRFIRTLQNFNKDTLNVSFLSFQDSNNVYMFYFYSRLDFFEQSKPEINNIIYSIRLLNE